jgi:hypothetical protein
MRALKTILASPASAKMVKVLFFHHHPFIVNNPFMELKDAREITIDTSGISVKEVQIVAKA